MKTFCVWLCAIEYAKDGSTKMWSKLWGLSVLFSPTYVDWIIPLPASAQAPPPIKGRPLRMGSCSWNYLFGGCQVKLQSRSSPRAVSDLRMKDVNSYHASLTLTCFHFFTYISVPINRYLPENFMCLVHLLCTHSVTVDLVHGKACPIGINCVLTFCRASCRKLPLALFFSL